MATQATQNLDDIAKICEANAIHTVELVFVDTWGIPRSKRLPVRQFLKGAGFAIAIAPMMWNPRCGIEDTSLATVGDGLPDVHATPDYDSFRVAGWEEGLGSVMCDLTDLHTHEYISMASRPMLKRQLANFASEGMYPQLATELEFHLLTQDWQPLYNEIFCYSSDKASELEPVVGGIRHALLRSGIEVEASNSEYGPGQIEINLVYGPGLKMADDTVIFKHALRNAIVPVVALAAVQLGFLLGGSIVIETIFALDGLGYLAYQSITFKDYPVTQIIVLLLSVIYILLTLASDIANAWLDPRIRVA